MGFVLTPQEICKGKLWWNQEASWNSLIGWLLAAPALMVKFEKLS